MKHYSDVTVEQIDALLPQTQCQECGYAGCRPYAQALLNKATSIDKCPPGGETTLMALAELLQHDPKPYIDNARQQCREPSVAMIREAECIGCTKCIKACPVDAIIGTAKQMHTVIAKECTGCGLCIPPCPMDCIDMLALSEKQFDPAVARKRYNARQQRLTQQRQQKVNTQKQQATDSNEKTNVIRAEIAAAVTRVKKKRSSSSRHCENLKEIK